MQKIKIGVVGTGGHASENLLPALHGVEGVQVVALFARDQEKATAVADRFNIPRVEIMRDVHQALDDKECDAFILSATPDLHQSFIKKAIVKGRHVFVEKPPVYLLEDIQALASLHANQGSPAVVQFGFNFRYSEFYRLFLGVVEQDKQYVRIRSFAAKPQNKMWGCKDILESSLLAVHIHAIEMLCYTLGKVQSVSSSITWLSDTAYAGAVLVKFENNRTGVLELSNSSNRFEFDFECASASGVLFRAEDFNGLTIIAPNGQSTQLLSNKSQESYTVPFLRGGYERTGYSTQFTAFADAIRENKPNHNDFPSCIEAYRIIKEICNG